jgi:transketolase C-terminal domain/subunit
LKACAAPTGRPLKLGRENPDLVVLDADLANDADQAFAKEFAGRSSTWPPSRT